MEKSIAERKAAWQARALEEKKQAEGYLKEKIKRVNALHKYRDSVIEDLKTITRKITRKKVDHSLMKVDYDAFNTLLHEDSRPEHIQAYVCSSEYSVWVVFRTSYPTSEYSCGYYNADVYLKPFDQENPAPHYEVHTPHTLKSVQAARKKSHDLQKKIDELKNKKDKLRGACLFER